MLEELSITNFAIIDRLAVRFGPGFNVLTGETGAGKSIIIDAVGAVLGGRVSAEMVRSGATMARVEAIFTLDEENGPIGELLRDIHGQSEHLSLFRVDEHLELLDRYAGNGPLRAELAALVGELRRLRRERDELQAAQADAARRLDLLRYQVDEITGAGLRPEEEEELVAEKRVLANAEKLAMLAGGASDLLSGADAGARGVLDALNEASTALAELVRLDESQARLDLLHRLKRKYGPTVADVIQFAEKAAREHEDLANSVERLEEP